MKESTVRARNNVKFVYTAGQLAINKIIENIGFVTDMEKEFPPYQVDIYIMSIHAAVEYDGAHSFKKKDKKRDEYLMDKYNLPIMRFEYFAPSEKVKQALIPYFKECAKRSENK
jgi:very-short-patch-repair endonuclease